MSTEINTGNMPINISAKSAKISAESSQKSAEQRVSSSSAQSIPTGSSDTVSMTDQVSRLQKIESQLAAVPPVDNARVAEIKQSIADGSFKVNPENIASKLIEMESGVISNDRG